uniref:M-AAA protease-interacting protein 1, mitochondrial n=1 Tax=Leptobrachium leishanense TaxID=445787 RepID=A0A8C5QNP6_9ANUR
MFPWGTHWPLYRMWRSGFRLTRLCARGPIHPPWGTVSSAQLRIAGAETVRFPARGYSGPPGTQQQVLVVGVPNPIIWFRTRIYFFLIRAYFDQEFTVTEFTEGAKQAFLLVSRLLSERKFEALTDLVANEVIQDVQEKCNSLSDNHRNALAARSEDLMFSTTGDVAIYYDNNRRFVNILMQFWYLTYADIPDDDEQPEGTKLFQVVLGDKKVKDGKRLITANYEFRREFTQGVKPEWIITRIKHSKLLE